MPVNNSQHQIFANEHNPGQVTTQHRAIERARLDAARQGVDPNRGSFQRDYNSEWVPSGKSDPFTGDPIKIRVDENKDFYQRNFVSPGGTKVEIKEFESDQAKGTVFPKTQTDHDLKVAVNDATYSKAAARRLLTDRFGIDI